MDLITGMFPYFVNPRFILLCLAGSIAGLFVGSIPGLSVSMATALLVSITYNWKTTDAMATICLRHGGICQGDYGQHREKILCCCLHGEHCIMLFKAYEKNNNGE